MSPNFVSETTDADGCSVTLRRVAGRHARELFLLCEPRAAEADPAGQAEAIYRAILGALAREGADFGAVVGERVFHSNLRADLGSVRAARNRVLASTGAAAHRPATTEVEQPPLAPHAHLAVAVHAIFGERAPIRVETVEGAPICACSECVASHGLRVGLGDEQQLHVGALYGAGAGAHEQTLAAFAAAERLLERAGMDFRHVVRTWIHLRDIDRDYADLNRARRAFFETRGIDPAPASTGIGGGPIPDAHELCLGFYALRTPNPPVRTAMSAPTLNEATHYGSDFARGIRIDEANKSALHVSGTASIDEAGRTAHPDDFEAQVERMLVNVAALLEGQGATFSDVVSAITYLKRPADAARLRAKLREAGFDGFPNALVAAPICRPELLCETEALAVLGTPS